MCACDQTGKTWAKECCKAAASVVASAFNGIGMM